MDAATMVKVLDVMIDAKVAEGMRDGASRESIQTIVVLLNQRAYWAQKAA